MVLMSLYSLYEVTDRAPDKRIRDRPEMPLRIHTAKSDSSATIHEHFGRTRSGRPTHDAHVPRLGHETNGRPLVATDPTSAAGNPSANRPDGFFEAAGKPIAWPILETALSAVGEAASQGVGVAFFFSEELLRDSDDWGGFAAGFGGSIFLHFSASAGLPQAS
jgi:hypothetical protein